MTQPDGSYSVVFPNGTGDYLVHISGVDLDAFRKRVTRVAAETSFTVNAQLHSAIAKLRAVQVKAKSVYKPQRDDPYAADFQSREVGGDFGASLSPSQMGDILAIASTFPGTLPTSAGASVLGLAVNQNAMLFNGMAFNGAIIPRDAQPEVRFSSSIYDPARGGFSGAETTVEVPPGSWVAHKTMHLTINTPVLQLPTFSPAGLSQRFNSVDIGLGKSGEVVEHGWVYRIAVQALHRTSPLLSLSNTSSSQLAKAGVSTDSKARLAEILSQLGAPLVAPRDPATSTQDQATTILRFDRKPTSRVSVSELLYLHGAKSSGLGLNQMIGPGAALSDHDLVGFDEIVRSEYFANKLGLSETRLGVNLTSNRRTSPVGLPSGSVLITSTLPDSALGSAVVGFGGAGDGPSWNKSSSVYLKHETIRMNATGTHRFKIAAEAGFASSSNHDGTNALGMFSFNSLDELEAGRPDDFTRTLSSATLYGALWRGFAAVGDLWKPSDTFQLLYGARLEGERFVRTASNVPAIESTFGLRTDGMPATVGVSPRLGFIWVYRTGKPPTFAAHTNQLGIFRNQGPSIVLRGGVGSFQSALPPSLFSDTRSAIDGSGTGTRLRCIGAATPSPNWTMLSTDEEAIPTTCRPGYSSIRSDSAISAMIIDRTYVAPRSWRGNLNLATRIWKWRLDINGTYSLNINQPSTIDVNFRGAEQFTTSDEHRPIFVPMSSVVPSSGAVSPVGGRLAQQFGRVVDVISDSRSVSRALTFNLQPDYQFLGHGLLAFSYTLADNHVRARGFDAPTFGSPRAEEVAPGDLYARHQIQLQAGYIFPGGYSASLFGRMWSGLRYTPLIGSDVNGDGLANDRAFVFNPATAPDSSVAEGLSSLLARGPHEARRCLIQQMGAAASRASCTGPWTTTLNARVDIPGERLGFGEGARISLNFVNILGALDQTLHGPRHARGWGAILNPDPVLYRVRGFDPAQGRFLYTVNSHFGSAIAIPQGGSPFGITLDVSIDFSESMEAQQLKRTLNSGRPGHVGIRMSADSIRKRYTHVVLDPYSYLLFYSDSLLLEASQDRAIREADARYRARLDSVWMPLAIYLSQLPTQYDAATALRTATVATDSAWALTKNEQERVQQILSPLQWQLVPDIIKDILDSKKKLHFELPG